LSGRCRAIRGQLPESVESTKTCVLHGHSRGLLTRELRYPFRGDEHTRRLGRASAGSPDNPRPRSRAVTARRAQSAALQLCHAPDLRPIFRWRSATTMPSDWVTNRFSHHRPPSLRYSTCRCAHQTRPESRASMAVCPCSPWHNTFSPTMPNRGVHVDQAVQFRPAMRVASAESQTVSPVLSDTAITLPLSNSATTMSFAITGMAVPA